MVCCCTPSIHICIVDGGTLWQFEFNKSLRHDKFCSSSKNKNCMLSCVWVLLREMSNNVRQQDCSTFCFILFFILLFLTCNTNNYTYSHNNTYTLVNKFKILKSLKYNNNDMINFVAGNKQHNTVANDGDKKWWRWRQQL